MDCCSCSFDASSAEQNEKTDISFCLATIESQDSSPSVVSWIFSRTAPTTPGLGYGRHQGTWHSLSSSISTDSSSVFGRNLLSSLSVDAQVLRALGAHFHVSLFGDLMNNLSLHRWFSSLIAQSRSTGFDTVPRSMIQNSSGKNNTRMGFQLQRRRRFADEAKMRGTFLCFCE